MREQQREGHLCQKMPKVPNDRRQQASSRNRSLYAAGILGLAAFSCLATGISPTAAQMSLPGGFAATDSGAAAYNIPISMPPGTAGMQPKLSLDYNSRGDNGLLGLGWSLSGIPAITRCSQTMAQDGVKGGIKYDANDRFCLEGERLFAVSGTYGANGTEYRVEREGFSKVVSNGTAGSGPAWFKVWTKSGQIVEFGNSADSRIEAQGSTTARFWAVNKISDTAGNYLTFTYTEDNANGDYRPARIDYTGNASAALSPYASVRFTYAARPDVTPLYEVASFMKTMQRLTNVKTYVGETVVADYRIAYDTSPSTQRSRVTSVMVCDAGPNCLPATSFTWQAPPATPQFTSSAGPAWAGKTPVFGDWNGDGRTDAIVDGTVYLANAQGQFASAWTIPANWATDFNIVTGDWNGDGKTDIALLQKLTSFNRYQDDGSWVTDYTDVGSTYLSTGTSFVLSGTFPGGGGMRPLVGDINGDGRSDLFVQQQLRPIVCADDADGIERCGRGAPDRTRESTVYYANAQGQLVFGPIIGFLTYETADVQLPQIDSDGNVDVSAWWSTVQVHDSDLGWITEEVIEYRTYPGWGTYYAKTHYPWYSPPVLGDWNGDGKTDAIRDGQTIFLQRGDGLLVSVGSMPTWGSVLLGDWNGDGKTDIAFQGNPTTFYTSTGTGFISAGSGPNLQNMTMYAGDWNGDGCGDLLAIPASGATTQYMAVCTPELITSVTNGLGATTSVTYKPLTDSSVYTKGSAATYPNVDLQGAMYVVSRIDTSNGIGGTSGATYSYSSAYGSQDGRGFLGFNLIRKEDLQTGIVQKTEYRLDYPFLGMVASVTTWREAAELVRLKRVENSYAADSLGGTRKLVKLTQTVEYAKDLNGTDLPTVTTTYPSYDSYGNPLSITVSASDGFSKATTNTYTNDAVNWILGRLTTTSVQSTSP